jgi:hypothetical protein
VVTCAHVVYGLERVTVAFPGCRSLPEGGARVADPGPWSGGKLDPGDVALLELDTPVDLPPAVFAGLEDPFATPPPRLVAYGFPYGYGQEGVLSELRATSRQLIAGEWTQVEAWTGYGQELAEGFSGAAAFLEGSGAVVGMISSRGSLTRNGRMIPARVLARHLPRLAEFVPTRGYGGEGKRRLCELVTRAEAATPQGAEVPYDVAALLRGATGTLGIAVPSAAPRTLWEAVWYLLSEAPPRADALPLAELAVRLADLVPDPRVGQELRAWAQEHRADFRGPAAAVAPSAPAAPGFGRLSARAPAPVPPATAPAGRPAAAGRRSWWRSSAAARARVRCWWRCRRTGTAAAA